MFKLEYSQHIKCTAGAKKTAMRAQCFSASMPTGRCEFDPGEWVRKGERGREGDNLACIGTEGESKKSRNEEVFQNGS